LISSNIAKESTRKSTKEKGRFYKIAFGSLIEVLKPALIAKDLGYLEENKLLGS